MNITLLVRYILPVFLWKILKKFKKQQIYFSLNNLDKKLEKYLNYKEGYYIEIGANDGLEQSNTAYFEKKMDWNGILVEPILHKYLECKKNRSVKNKFFCCACVSFKFDKEFVKCLYSNLMSISTNIENDIQDKFGHANFSNTERKEQQEVVEFFAKARTLNDILIESSAPKIIDLFSLDVEGSEFEVLQGIDFEKFSFKFILIETRSFEKVKEFLNFNNYIFVEKLSIHDYLFKHKTNNLKNE